MPTEPLTISNLTEIGLVVDTPAVSLPPNVFSDVQNVRFRDGAVQKFPGETDRFTSTGIDYVAFWPAPSGDKYVVIRGTTLQILNASYSNVSYTNPESISISDSSNWQHTLFNGGFHIIINNGAQAPMYIQDDSTPVIKKLPGWESYAPSTAVKTFEYEGETGAYKTISTALASGDKIKVEMIPKSAATPRRSETVTVNGSVGGVTPDGTLVDIGTIDNVSATGFRFTPNDGLGGSQFIISLVAQNPVTAVTAGVIRAYGNLLVAGNLTETGGNGRKLTGVVRTSDVAPPGNMPLGWNPFEIGASTADEFTLSSTGTIQDMAELQGVLYIYTDTSIHALQRTGNSFIPFQFSTITDSYGANNTGSVLQVDGKHIVYGSGDVYVFAGHPGSIASIADGRVRSIFRQGHDYKAVRFNLFDEIWFYRNNATQYVWNYRKDVWTKRVGSAPLALDSIDNNLILATATKLKTVNENYLSESYVERRRISITPEFDTESLSSIAFIVEGSGTLEVDAVGSNAPGDNKDPTASASGQMNTTSFNIANDYKQDIRVHGRFLNYRVTHTSTSNTFNLTGMQFGVSKGGQR